jgi:DNA repair protein RadD
MTFKLRDYQNEAVESTIKHFRKSDDSAVIVLPTGAGKSLVIAELARLAKRKILVLAHVKELVEQNHAKYQSYGLNAGIYSAGLKQKTNTYQVTFASIQSVARNLEDFSESYSLVIIDECHRVSGILDENQKIHETSSNRSEKTSQYLELLQQLKNYNPGLKVLGLTATPYRMGVGWIYRYHYNGFTRADEVRPFRHCIYELPLIYMINRGYLTKPKLVDATVEHYDFSYLQPASNGSYNGSEVNALLEKYPRVTQGICEQIMQITNEEGRKGVMVFAATVKHAQEIASYLPSEKTALITGETSSSERDRLISLFKARELHYLVNVSVLTTGFDAPHVDFIAILRPTESVSLYQQIVGRGLRLSEDKDDCLVIDYAGNNFNLYYPEVGDAKPDSDSEPVMVVCPKCEFSNTFWGKMEGGVLIEHFGRRCQGLVHNQDDQKVQCDYRFKFKECGACGAENDIAARECCQCYEALVDPDDQLKSALKLKDAKVIRCAGVSFGANDERLKVIYHDEQGEELSEYFDFSKIGQRRAFNALFGKRFKQGSEPQNFSKVSEVINHSGLFSSPDFVIARKQGRYWKIQHRIFDYQGRFRKANYLN